MSVISELATVLRGAPIQDIKVCRDEPGTVHHFWSIHGGSTVHIRQVDRRFVGWVLENKPIGVVFNDFLKMI